MPPRLKLHYWRQNINSLGSRRCQLRQFNVISRPSALKRSLPQSCRTTVPEFQNVTITKRSFSTSFPHGLPDTEISRPSEHFVASAQATLSTQAVDPSITIPAETLPPPTVLGPLKPEDTFSRRYPAIIEQFVGLIMKHGKKARAQRYLAVILNRLRTAPAPRVNSSNQLRPLVPGHPPGEQLPYDPIGYLTLAVDSVAPLIRIRNQKGIKGGGASLLIPVPLNVRQRRRRAINWIIDSASKKKNRGSGRDTFPLRVADEIIAIVEGRSAIWDKRMQVHKEGVVGRVNVSAKRVKGRRM